MNNFEKWKGLKAEIEEKQSELAALAPMAEADVLSALGELRSSTNEPIKSLDNIPCLANDNVDDMPTPTATKKPTSKRAKIVSPGEQYNNWTVVKHAPEKGNHFYLCRCVCGHERNVSKYDLGKTIGCGCTRKNAVKKHASNVQPKSITTDKPAAKPKPYVSSEATNASPVTKPTLSAGTLSPRQQLERFKEQRELEKELSGLA